MEQFSNKFKKTTLKKTHRFSKILLFSLADDT